MKRILIVGSQHGNELLGERFYAFTQRQLANPQLGLTFLLANPKARKQHVRYLESDMNRSFTGSTKTYEERQAQFVLRYISRSSFDLVIDAHTTTVDQAPCIIVPSINKANAEYLQSSYIKNIVIMKHNFVKSALIGNVSNALSIEVSNTQLGPALYQKLYAGLVDYALGMGHYPRKAAYIVSGLIEKSQYSAAESQRLQNFTRSCYGFYPVLTGENSYRKLTHYLGFKAETKKRIELSPRSSANLAKFSAIMEEI